MDKISKSKIAMKNLFNLINCYCISTTGSNLCNILLYSNQTSIQHFNIAEVMNIHYHILPPTDSWRINILNITLAQGRDLDYPPWDVMYLR